MKANRLAIVAMFVVSFFTPCFAHHMAVVVNKENNVGNVSSAYLAKMFRSEIKNWSDGQPVVLILHRSSAGETETLQHLIKVSPAEWKAFVAAHKDSIQLADSDVEVLKIVQATPGAVGLIDVRAVDGSIHVVRVDGKLPMESGYLPH
jgi:ABC-type phosphate transport system substrate-binding protein